MAKHVPRPLHHAPRPYALPCRCAPPEGDGAAYKARPVSTALPDVEVEPATDGLDLAFVQRLVPWFRTLRTYTRLRVSGLEHVPRAGPALLAGNHTGWLGLDYALTALSVYEETGRVVRGMAHEAWFRARATREFATKCGIVQVSKMAMRERLAAGDLVMMFPEGERGAFKPGTDYALEPFARGFVRVALETGVPVVPVAILGGAESNPVGARVEGYEDLLRMRGGLPIPRNLLPKPVKWRIRFLEPLDLSDHGPEDAADKRLVHGLAEEARERIQDELRALQRERGHPYL